VVYGPPDVEKKRTKMSPRVPIARGSFCFIDHTSMTKRTIFSAPNVSGKRELFRIHRRTPGNRKEFFLLPARALRCRSKSDLRNTLSIIRVKVDARG
jgi:hypothetical protein